MITLTPLPRFLRPALLGLLIALLVTGGLATLGLASYAGLVVSQDRLESDKIGAGGDHAYVYTFNNPLIRWGLFYTESDDVAGDFVKSAASTLTLFEDGKALGPAHSLHRFIRSDGGGAYSHCVFGRALLFSASDNSDPSRNGRSYLARTPIKMAPPLFDGILALFSGLLTLALILGLAPGVARRSLPHDRYENGERFWLFCCGTALAWFALALLPFNLAGCPDAGASMVSCLKTRDDSLYVFSFLLVPLLAWGSFAALRHIESRGGAGAIDWVILVNALILPPALAMLALLPGAAVWFGPLALGAALCAVIVTRRWPALAPLAAGAIPAALVRLSAAAGGVALVLLPIALDDHSRAWFARLLLSPWFALGAAAGLAAVATVVFRSPPWKPWSPIEKTGFAIVIPVILAGSLQPGLLGEWPHLATYLGPALAVLDGRVPLVDVQCQYGLSYLVFVAGFLLGIEPSFAGTVFISTLTDAAELVVFMVLVGRLTRSPVLACVCGLGALLLIMTLLPFHNVNPSQGGTRFLPPLALALALPAFHKKGPAAWSFMACLMWCVLWSLETCFWGLLTATAAVIVRNLPLAVWWRRLLREAAWIAGGVALTLLAAFTLIVLWAGQAPRLKDYLGMVLAHVGTDNRLSWSSPVPDGFLYWLPLGLILVMVLVAGVVSLFSRTSLPMVAPLLPIVPLATLAIAQWAYYVGHSTEDSLLTGSLPAMAVAMAVFAIALRSAAKPARAVVVTVAAVAVAVMFGTGTGRLGFSRDIVDAAINSPMGLAPVEMMPLLLRPLPDYAPDLARMVTVLAQHQPGVPVDRDLYRAAGEHLHLRANRDLGGTTAPVSRDLGEIVDLIHRHDQGSHRIAIIDSNYWVADLVFSGHSNTLPISSTGNDVTSPSRIEYIAGMAPRLVGDGENIFVSSGYQISDGIAVPDDTPDHALGYAVLASLNARWTFSLVEEGRLLSVYRLVPRRP